MNPSAAMNPPTMATGLAVNRCARGPDINPATQEVEEGSIISGQAFPVIYKAVCKLLIHVMRTNF